MKKIFWGLTLVSFILVACREKGTSPGYQSLRDGFENPSLSAKPRAYWVWPKGNFNMKTLTAELEEARAKGMGGFDIFDVNAVDNRNIIPPGPAFLSDGQMKGIAHAVEEAGVNGLEMGFIVSSSWNAGGPWITPEHGVKGLFKSETRVNGPAHISIPLPFPEIDERIVERGKNFGYAPDEKGFPPYYKDIAVLAIPEGGSSSANAPRIIDPEKIIILNEHFNDQGVLEWDAPEGKWKIVRYVCTNTYDPLKIPSPNSNGLVIDHFDPAATEFHMNYCIDRLRSGIPDLENSALNYLYIASYEVNFKPIWTPAFLEEFTSRRGYDMTRYLPVIFDAHLGDSIREERFMHDFRMTLSDLIIDNHYRKARDICHVNGLKLHSEAGGPGPPLHNCPFEALKALGSLDVPRGEFWVRHVRRDEDGIDLMQLVKEIACAAHIYDLPVVECEAFTGLFHWQEGPGDLKPLADQAMCEGLNRFVFHVFTHSPEETGVPGWAWTFGTHINTKRVWWPKAEPFMQYLARSCYMLQQGNFVGDVLFYYGDKAPNFVRPKHIHPSLGYGYDYDYINSEVILDKLYAENGRLVLPGGQTYALLVLPAENTMNPDVLEKVGELVEEGALVTGPRPERSYGLAGYAQKDKRVRELAEKLWDNPQKGVITGKSLREILNARGTGPDFSFAGGSDTAYLDFIHRKAKQEDIYFLWNRTRGWEHLRCHFRVEGKIPERWDPVTGKVSKIPVFSEDDTGITIPLHFGPEESFFIVFSNQAPEDHITGIERNGQVLFPATGRKQGKLDDQRSLPFEISPSGKLVFTREGKYRLITSSGKQKELLAGPVPQPMEISGPWDLNFPGRSGAPDAIRLDSLISWPESEIPGVRYFSGIASYTREFELPAGAVPEQTDILLDLGRVEEVADVRLNGTHVGILWHGSFLADISGQIREGKNLLEIEVANTRRNRMIGDAFLPPEERITRSNINRGPNSWDRPLNELDPLPAGLMGPVRLIFRRVAAPYPG